MARVSLQQHIDNWKNCQRCELAACRRNVVIGRGDTPADIVFVGEAPGGSENVIGRPFVGPAGHLLDDIIRRSLPTGIKFAITNLVLCIPLEDGEKILEPPEEAIEACSIRLREFVAMCEPKLLVAVGKLAKDWLTPGFKHSIAFYKELPVVDIIHPAAILRANIAGRGLLKQRAIITLKNAAEELVCPSS